MKVLIIDDDSDLLEMCARRLRKKGIDVQTSLNLNDAIEIIKKDPDLKAIICDLFLSNGENGIDFFETLSNQIFKEKFILTTGDDSADNRIEKLKLMHSNFTCFQKPYSIEDILSFLG
ncbi:response regulator [Fluviispira multicolorata]|uniref:Response regulator n=1 Tax=Fluviispira multicolorata TaxID=2654512 RepID=A0A833N3W8_9BACT|nr:response regulator [Fluviispira multicolorata]KAB8030784.1 response regulator [Fluviispira multicolorata]